MKSFTALIFFHLCMSIGATGQVSLASNDEAFIDSVVSNGMMKQGVPGAGIIIIQNGKVVLQKAYGFADIEKKLCFQSKTLFFQWLQ